MGRTGTPKVGPCDGVLSVVILDSHKTSRWSNAWIPTSLFMANMATWYSDRGTMGETMALIRVRSPARGFLVVNKAIFGVSAKGIKTSLFRRLLIMAINLVGFRVRPSYAGGRKIAQNGYSGRCLGVVYALVDAFA